MAEIFSQPDDLGEIRASDLHTSLGEQLGAHFMEAAFGGTRTLYRIGEYSRADAPTQAQADEFALRGPAHGVGVLRAQPGQPFEPPAEVSIDDARKRIKDEGLEGHVKLPEQPSIRQGVLDLMVAHGRERRDYENAVSRGPQGFFPGALGFVTQIGAGILDPVNDAAFMIPVVGEARQAALLARAGTSVLARAGVRAGVGAAQGAVGMAALQPADWWLHTRDGVDYTMADALKNIVLGAGMGAVMHAGIGGIGDLRARLKGLPLAGSAEDQVLRAITEARERPPGEPVSGKAVEPPANPESPGGQRAGETERTARTTIDINGERVLDTVNHPAEIFADLPPEARADLVRAAAADVIADRPGRAGDVLAIAADHSDRIAESVDAPRSLSAAANPPPEPPAGARIAGHSQHGPMVEGLADRPAEAIGWLREARTGEAVGVLPMPDRPERVDLISGRRGRRGYGVEHVDEKHPGALDHLPEAWPRMRVVREGGGFVEMATPDGWVAVVAQNYAGEPKNWLLTFFGRRESVAEEGMRGPQETLTGPGAERPTGQSTAPPRGGSVRPAGESLNRAAEDFGALRDRPDPDALADRDVSRQAEAAAEPPSVDPAKSLTAAEQAAAAADELLKDLEPRLTEAERTAIADSLAELKADRDAAEQLLREGAACLIEAIG